MFRVKYVLEYKRITFDLPPVKVFVMDVQIKSRSCFSVFSAQRLERLRKERQNQIKCKNIQWKERSSNQSGKVTTITVLLINN